MPGGKRRLKNDRGHDRYPDLCSWCRGCHPKDSGGKVLCTRDAEHGLPYLLGSGHVEASSFLIVPLIYSLTGGKGLTLPLVTEEELKIMLDQGRKAGELESEEVKMIKNVFQLKDITAEDAMTPRIYVFSLDGNLRLKEAQELLYNSKYSRIPLYDGMLDNIMGILYKTKALTELAKGRTDLRLRDIAHPPLFVPAGKTADDLMKQFQQDKRHMGVSSMNSVASCDW